MKAIAVAIAGLGGAIITSIIVVGQAKTVKLFMSILRINAIRKWWKKRQEDKRGNEQAR